MTGVGVKSPVSKTGVILHWIMEKGMITATGIILSRTDKKNDPGIIIHEVF